jgi:DNA-binding FrmR family transcriptional regulator
MQTTHTKALIDRLSRAEGQIRALKRILEEDGAADCKTFIAQVKAVRSALRAVSEEFIIKHLDTCQKLPLEERQAQMRTAVTLLTTD